MMAGSQASVQVIIGPQWTGGAEGLKHVAAIRNASTLSLHSAPLGDDAIEHIASLSHLRRIEMFGTQITPDAVKKLQPQLPNTQLDVRGGARLGIGGLVIQRIIPDSPAAKAGLQLNDKVLEFAGEAIDDTGAKGFEQLTQLIAKCKPGDTVTVKVQRGTETLEKSVTFDRWGDDQRTIMNSPELQQGFVPVQIQGGPIIIRNAPALPIVPVPAQEQRR
jgi:predicted metalloprotease with PDZ domain